MSSTIQMTITGDLIKRVIVRFSSTVWTVKGSPLPDLQALDPQLLKPLTATSNLSTLKIVEQNF